MRTEIFTDMPVQYESISLATKQQLFDMSSDLYTGSLLKTLVASKVSGKILELGTGTGLATSWILDGMDKNSKLVTIDNNEVLINIAKQYLNDERIEFVCADGYEWIKQCNEPEFDLIFADAMPGKYELFEEAIALLKRGGFYVVDDMIQQSNWPDGHAEKVEIFIDEMENNKNITLTKLNWSTGIIIATKICNN
jgi:predicted O-methyltransferase YrrM